MWKGTAFSCATNEIILRHNSFMEGTEKDCNDGAIIGDSLGVEYNCFTSRLRVTVINDFNDTTIGCFMNTDSSADVVNSTSITVISGNQFNC